MNKKTKARGLPKIKEVSEYRMPTIEVGDIFEGEVLVPMSSFYLEGLGATEEEIDAAAQPGKCIIVNGQKWLVDVKIPEVKKSVSK